MVMYWIPTLLSLGYLWFKLINNLRLEWTTDPQYGYGLLVPFLCIGLLVRRWHGARRAKSGERRAESGGQKLVIGDQKPAAAGLEHSGAPRVVSSLAVRGLWSVIFLLGLLYLPTRLVEAATPEWRPIQWSLGVIVIGLTLCAIYAGMGRGWVRQLAFPICFFFVAIPWPTLVEQPIIQNLTRVSAAIVVELLVWIGVPAVAHGNVIEVSTGVVGIDEACSGIRSFQSSLMISLFFGEFYRLSTGRRWVLVPLGYLFSMAFNVCRMSWLTLIAAKKGVPAISEYHDEAGITIAILCTLALWGVAVLLKRHKTADHRSTDHETTGLQDKGVATADRETTDHKTTSSDIRPLASELSTSTGPWSVVRGLSIALLIWLVLVEAGVQTWYHVREANLKPGPTWTLTFPQNNPTLKDIPMDAKTRYLLRFDDFKQAAWTESDGTQWAAFYFNWSPGRVAGYLAKRHTPEICLTATGIKLLSGPQLTMMNVHGVKLPIRCYEFQNSEGVIQVFHCRWEAGEQSSAYVAHESARYNLIRAVWAGRGNQGQKVLEVVISGMSDPEQAKAAVARQLDKLIVVQGAEAGGPRKAAERPRDKQWSVVSNQ